eukprot:1159631-Pelagomonas_calceolata.AAC.9
MSKPPPVRGLSSCSPAYWRVVEANQPGVLLALHVSVYVPTLEDQLFCADRCHTPWLYVLVHLDRCHPCHPRGGPPNAPWAKLQRSPKRQSPCIHLHMHQGRQDASMMVVGAG